MGFCGRRSRRLELCSPIEARMTSSYAGMKTARGCALSDPGRGQAETSWPPVAEPRIARGTCSLAAGQDRAGHGRRQRVTVLAQWSRLVQHSFCRSKTLAEPACDPSSNLRRPGDSTTRWVGARIPIREDPLAKRSLCRMLRRSNCVSTNHSEATPIRSRGSSSVHLGGIFSSGAPPVAHAPEMAEQGGSRHAAGSAAQESHRAHQGARRAPTGCGRRPKRMRGAGDLLLGEIISTLNVLGSSSEEVWEEIALVVGSSDHRWTGGQRSGLADRAGGMPAARTNTRRTDLGRGPSKNGPRPWSDSARPTGRTTIRTAWATSTSATSPSTARDASTRPSCASAWTGSTRGRSDRIGRVLRAPDPPSSLIGGVPPTPTENCVRYMSSGLHNGSRP